MCNDRSNQKVKSLATHCLDLPFQRPSPEDIIPRINFILKIENFPLPLEVIPNKKNNNKYACLFYINLNFIFRWLNI